MERRHQVFVSSTYEDLVDERHQVILALLELDCMPAGMELFPAADEDSWSLIKGVIDDSDYYVVVVAGRYGSIGPDGVSYTEMEYDYAVSTGKPVIAFLHEDPSKIESGKSEDTDVGKEKLEQFRGKIKQRQCKTWSTAEDLGGKVSRSLVQLRKKHPSLGWVQGRYAADDTMLRELDALRRQVAELTSKTGPGAALPPEGSEDFAQGDEKISITVDLPLKGDLGRREEVKSEVTWDNLLRYTGPSLVGECDDKLLHERIKLCFMHGLPPEAQEKYDWHHLVVPYVVLDQVTVQLQALGYIAVGEKRRTVSDTSTYWRLTPYGHEYLIKLRARKRGTSPVEEGPVEQEDQTEPTS